MRRWIARPLIGIVSGAVIVTGLPAAPAQAASPEVAAFNAALDGIAAWSDGLASVGQMAEALPLLGSSPGAIAGVNDALQEALTKVRSVVGNDLDYDEQDLDLGGGRTADVTASIEDVGPDKVLTFTAEVTNTEADQALTIPIDIGGDTSAFSSTGGISATSTVTFGFELVYVAGTPDQVYARVPGTSITVSSSAAITDVAAIDSAIGILGLKVVDDPGDPNDTTLTLASNLNATLTDPNNDGRWTSDELAAAGSLDGLVDVGFGSPAGSVAGSLHLKSADASIGSGVALPGVDLILGFAWPDISTGTPTVNAPDIGQVGAFLNMDVTDLASNIAQLATTLTSIQRTRYSEGATPTGDLDLPFFGGTLADAIPLNESLKKFLDDNVNPADKDDPAAAGLDPAELGKPTFSSLQDMLAKLDAINAPADISLGDIGFDDTSKEFVFTLGIQRAAPGSPIDLNGSAKTTSGSGGSVTYSPDSVTDTAQSWKVDEWAGARIVAGNVGATVKGNSANELTLDDAGWIPNVPPANGTPYSLAGASGNVGVVALGDSLKSGGRGIGNANGLEATAKVSPSYSAAITVVLDLQDPIVQDPPIEDPDGGSALISALPQAKDRILIRPDNDTPLFTADFPITGAIDIFANAGFLQVELTGQASVCHSYSGSDCSSGATGGAHMVAVTLKGSDDLMIKDIVRDLLPTGNPDDLLDVDVNVGGSGSVTVSVPGASAFFTTAPGASFAWKDVTSGSPSFDVSDLDELVDVDFDPDNPGALFSIVLKTLQTLEKSLTSTSVGSGADGIFNTQIPLLGRSLSELLAADESGAGDSVTFGAKTLTDTSKTFTDSLKGRTVVVGTQVGVIEAVSGDTLTMAAGWNVTPQPGTAYSLRSELSDAISLLEASPSDNLQALMKTVNDRLAGTPITLEYRKDASVGGVPSLVLALDWQRSYKTDAPIQFSINPSDPGAKELVGVAGSGRVRLGVDGHITIGLVIPLAVGEGPADASQLKVLDDSSVGVAVDTAMDDLAIAANVGPLAVSLGDPSGTDKGTVRASYALDLADSSATGEAVGFDSFFGSLGAQVNAASADVAGDCGGGFGPTPLAACAVIPLYWDPDADGTYTKVITDANKANSFELRLPKVGVGSDPTFDVIDLTGGQIDGKDRIVAPDLQAIFDSLKLDFTQFQGIDQFLASIETALNVASFGGKLPLIGDDLQQGKDFVGQMRKAARDALGDFAATGTTKEVADALTQELEQAFGAADMAPDFTVVLECPALSEPGDPTLVIDSGDEGGDNGTADDYTYAVAAYVLASDGSTLRPGPLSGSVSTTNGPDALAPDTPVHLSWPAVTGADGYLVYKYDNGEFKQLGEPVASPSTLTFDDSGQSLGDAHSSDGPPAKDCQLDGVQSVQVSASITKGKWTDADLACVDDDDTKKECLTAGMPLDIGIPGLSLRAKDGEGPEIALGWNLAFGFGVSREDGFFVDAGSSGSTPEIAFGLKFSMPSEMQAQLAIINVTISDCDKDVAGNKGEVCTSTAGDALFDGVFALDLVSPHSNGRLTIGDFADGSIDSLFDITLSADLDINWFVEAQPGTDDDPGFPGVVTQFVMSWGWDDEAVDDADTSSALAIAFNNVSLDVGAVFSDILGPIVRQLKSVTGPLDPVIKTLYAPIPVLSDMSHAVGGDDVTLVSIAKSFSTIAGGPDLEFVDKVVAIVTLINNLPEGDTVLIPIGSFTVAGQKALDTSATPDNTESLIETKSPSDEADGGVLAELDDERKPGASADGTFDGADSQTVKAGLAFPVFEQPTSLFNLVMGGDVTLVTFDSGPLTLGFTWQQSFGPVYAPPPVLITLGGSASVTARIKAGFDTYGIRKAVEVIQAGGTVGSGVASILQGLYFATTDDAGKPIPVVSFRGEIAAGAQVSALIITVGVEGGIRLTVSFLWNDPNNDGRFRITEFAQAALNNPICLFQVSGALSVFLRVYVTVGISPFSVTFSFTLVDVTLLDFSIKPDCAPPPPDLGAVSGDGTTLLVYAGRYGTGTLRGHSSYDNGHGGAEPKAETIKITSLHSYADPTNPTFVGIGVEMLNIRREFRIATLARVIVDGRGHGAPLKVTFLGDAKLDTSKGKNPPPTASFEKDAIVFGGTKNDMIKTGIGNSWVDGGAGNDTIVTGDRTVYDADGDFPAGVAGARAVVAGGPGADSITVGNGTDVVAGDRALDHTQGDFSGRRIKTKQEYLDGLDDAGNSAPAGTAKNVATGGYGISSPTTEAATDGGDSIGLGLGDAKAYGNGGGDSLQVVTDNPLAGTEGAPAWFGSKGVEISGGTGSDTIVGGSNKDIIMTGVDAGGLDGANGQDGQGDDDGESADLGPDIRNTVDTGTGNDVVYGSKGEDLVTSRSRFAETARIIGGGGNDILTGGFGTDKVFGGPGDDYVIAEPSEVQGVQGVGAPVTQDGPFGPLYTVLHQPLPNGVSSNSKTLVGGYGNDHIVGGDGASAIDGDGYNATDRCEPGDPVASDPVDESVNTADDGNDKILGGAGEDNVRAGGGNDEARVKGSGDLVCGEKGADVLYGGDHDDSIWGGSGEDLGYGEAGADLVFGSSGDDALYGGAGADVLEGNRGDDLVSGGSEDDVALGGTRKAGRDDDADPGADWNDRVYGDTGVDQLFGDNAELAVVGDHVAGTYGPRDLDGADSGYGGRDVLFGGDADDLMYGGLDDDDMYGGDGNDRMQGNNGEDSMFGESGEDELTGGSSQRSAAEGVGRPDVGDWIRGGAAADLVLGDNGWVDRVALGSGTPITLGRGFTEHGYDVTLLDKGSLEAVGTAGADYVEGGAGADVILGQGDVDRLKGGEGDDYVEGAQGSDWIEGNAGDDDLVGGGHTVLEGTGGDQVGQDDSADAVFGGPGDDVITGDNASVLRVGPRTSSTERVGTSALGLVDSRSIALIDLNASSPLLAPQASKSGADRVSGGGGVDVLYGQDGDDRVSGGGHDDYLEGNGGADIMRGDLWLDSEPDPAGGGGSTLPGLTDPGWPGDATGPSVELEGAGADGQDDMIGGSSRPAFRDAGDDLSGNGGGDFQLGDNGTLHRVLSQDQTSEAIFDQRYPNGAPPPDAVKVRVADSGNVSTRFCPPSATGTCEPAGAYGADTFFGNDGDDGQWGQDGDDEMFGNAGQDTMHGEMGDDTMYGNAGDDAMIGDRGGILSELVEAGDPIVDQQIVLSMVPQETYVLHPLGTIHHHVDLLHDVNGAAFVGASLDPAMPQPGLNTGGKDRMRGGTGQDNLHGGFNDDLMNGEAGGDVLFGDDGKDVMWGGQGCDRNAPTPDCYLPNSTTLDAGARGDNDRFLDHLQGGVGDDVLDFRPRGTYAQCVAGSDPVFVKGKGNNPGTVNDPCAWFEMTGTDDDSSDPDTLLNNEHHEGTDWMYGGWNRDVLQADVSQNGKNPGDRQLDWNGSYNLYTVCNSSNGGFNQVRQHSPAMQDFLQKVAWGEGAGQAPVDAATPGTSAHRELALAYPGENSVSSGSAFPTTPGHFDLVSCAP